MDVWICRICGRPRVRQKDDCSCGAHWSWAYKQEEKPEEWEPESWDDEAIEEEEEDPVDYGLRPSRSRGSIMFFSRTNLERILRGKKTQTRRLSGCYQVGHTYGVRTWIYEKTLVRIRITAKRQERLGDISAADIEREGYVNIWQFAAAWESFHAKKLGWHPELIVWVYDFELVEAPAEKKLPPPPSSLFERGPGKLIKAICEYFGGDCQECPLRGKGVKGCPCESQNLPK